MVMKPCHETNGAAMGPFQLMVTWQKITTLENKLPTGTSKTKTIQILLDEVASVVLDVKVCNLLSSMADSVQCDCYLHTAHLC